jgi:hypothetical protein
MPPPGPPALILPLLVSCAMWPRLQGVACVRCGVTGTPLTPVGYAVTITSDGGSLGWPVRACARHQAPGVAGE